MTAPAPDPEMVPDEVAAALASDLLVIVGHLVAQSGTASQAAVTLAALDRGRAVLAGFHRDALAWPAGPGPVPCWQSWANRLALALDGLLAAQDAPTASDAGREGGGSA